MSSGLLAEKRQISPASLANLKPFQKGRSGNPAGRPKLEEGRRKVQRLARAHTRAAILGLRHLAEHAEDETVRYKAWVALLAQGWGSPPTSQTIVREGGAPLVNIDARGIQTLPRDLSQADALAWLERIAPAPPEDPEAPPDPIEADDA